MIGLQQDIRKYRAGKAFQLAVTGFFFLGVAAATVAAYSMGIERLPPPILIEAMLSLFIMACISMLGLAAAVDRLPPDRCSFLFFGLLLSSFLGVAFDGLVYLFNGKPRFLVASHIFTIGSFLAVVMQLRFFWSYQNALFPDNKNRSRRFALIVDILAAADILFILIASATGFLYRIDDRFMYQQGPGYFCAFILPFAILLVCLIDILRRKTTFRRRLVLLLFCVAPIVLGGLALLLEEQSLAYAFAFLNLVLVYSAIQTQRGLEQAQREKALTEIQTQVMLSQIQPHFLFNTLSVIYSLCGKDPMLAREVLGKFSDYLRANMTSLQSNQTVPFEKELEHTKTYLWIEQQRFGDILKVEYDIQYTDFRLPSITLQPLVENAVKHGIRSREEGGTVIISVRREHGKIYVRIIDNGIGFDTKLLSDGNAHIGIDNSRARLKLMCDAELMIESKVGFGTTATIVLEDMGETNESASC